MTHSEETLTLPSASGYERLALCPGSFAAESDISDHEDDAYATHGDKIHRALVGEKLDLDHDEEDTFDRCQSLTVKLTAQVFGDETNMEVLREQRLWLFDSKLRKMFSGKADFIAVCGAKALVIDFKTLFGEQTESNRNPQLRALAVLVAFELDISDVDVAVIQPRVSMSPQVCHYDASALELAEAELRGNLVRASDPNAPRIPGEKQCKHCRAKTDCPEARNSVELVARPEWSPQATIQELSGESLSMFLSRCSLAQDVIAAARKEARRRLTEGQEVPGWKLSPGQNRREITDVQTVFSRVNAKHGVTMYEFVKICGVGLGDFENLVRAATKKANAELKGEKLKSEVNELLAGAVEVKPTQKTLERA